MAYVDISSYVISFLFSLSFCGLLFLLTGYIKQINGRNDISKLSLRPYLFAMVFCLIQSAEMIFFEMMAKK